MYIAPPLAHTRYVGEAYKRETNECGVTQQKRKDERKRSVWLSSAVRLGIERRKQQRGREWLTCSFFSHAALPFVFARCLCLYHMRLVCYSRLYPSLMHICSAVDGRGRSVKRKRERERGRKKGLEKRRRQITRHDSIHSHRACYGEGPHSESEKYGFPLRARETIAVQEREKREK